MRPRELAGAWVEAFNRADPDDLASFCTDDAVSRQVAGSPVHGRAAIRDMFAAGIVSQRGDWARLSFLRAQGRPVPQGLQAGRVAP